jgi:hypothetical protein
MELKLKKSEPVAVAEAVIITKTTIPFNAQERQPSSWSITLGINTEIRAANSNTGRVFEGAIAEFNSLLHATL